MTQRPPPRGNPTPAQILAAAKKVRAPGHKLAGRKTYVPTPLKRHAPRPTPGAASYPKGVRYGYPDPRVWNDAVRDNPTLAQVRAAASRGASAAARGARSAYAYAAPRAKAAARATAAAAKRGAKRAAPHVARGARAVAGRLDAYAARENPSRGPIDHKFAGSLFSAGQPKIALAYLRGTMAKGTARELVAAKLKKARR